MKFVLLFLVFFLVVQDHITSACKCALPPHLQNYVCDADFVMRGRVIKDKVMGLTRKYTVRIQKLYKGPGSYKKFQIIKTPKDSAACGVYLEKGKTYLLTGSIDGNMWKIHSCSSYHMMWKDVSKTQKRYLKNDTYLNNCGCLVKACREEMPCPLHLSCNLNYDDPYDIQMCYKREAYCQVGKKGCLWRGTKKFYNCIE